MNDVLVTFVGSHLEERSHSLGTFAFADKSGGLIFISENNVQVFTAKIILVPEDSFFMFTLNVI